MTFRSTARFTTSLSVLALAMIAVPALAQTQTANSATADEEIVVTAQKRAQNLSDVPAAIQAITATMWSAFRIS